MPNNIDISCVRLDTGLPVSNLIFRQNKNRGVYRGYNTEKKIQTIFLKKIELVWNWVLKIFGNFTGNYRDVSVCLKVPWLNLYT